MARTAIVKQAPAAAGANQTFTAVDASAAPNGMYYDTDGSDVVFVKNTDSGAHTMTVDVAVSVDSVAVADRTVTVPAGQTVVWQAKNVHRQSNGQVHLNFDSATGMSISVIDVTPQ